MRISSVCVSLLSFLLLPLQADAQVVYPAHSGDRTECYASIEMSKGSITGVGVLVNDSDTIRGAIINEFGITALQFEYYPGDDKVKLISAMPMLDKWYIRKVLTSDIRQLLLQLRDGTTTYTDKRYGITYTLTPLNDNDDSDDAEEPSLQD